MENGKENNSSSTSSTASAQSAPSDTPAKRNSLVPAQANEAGPPAPPPPPSIGVHIPPVDYDMDDETTSEKPAETGPRQRIPRKTIQFDDISEFSNRKTSSTTSNEELYASTTKTKLLSIIYGLIVLTLGVILPIVETSMTNRTPDDMADSVFEIYLFFFSIVFFFYWFIDIDLFRRSRKKHRRENFNNPEIVFEERYTLTDHMHDGLYLRVGLGLFCMVSLIENGLQIAQAFEYKDFCGPLQIFIRNVLHFLFTFIQYCFLFRNSNMVIQSNLLISHLGIAHIIVTNLCVWFKFILEETFESTPEKNETHSSQSRPSDPYNFSYPGVNYLFDESLVSRMNLSLIDPALMNFTLMNSNDHHSSTPPTHNQTSFNTTLNLTDVETNDERRSCVQVADRVYNIIQRLSPFLHPCTIEYSIIAVTLFYLIWKSIGNTDLHKKTSVTRRYSVAVTAAQIYHVDCNRTLKGLFLGILTILFTMIVAILYVVATATDTTTNVHDPTSLYSVSLYITEALELGLLVTMIVSLLQAFFLMRNLSSLAYKEHFEVDLEEAQEIFGLFGTFSFSIFRILAFRFAVVKSGFSYILLCNGILSIIVSLVQSVFILFGNKKRCLTGQEISEKRGREQITFLIMANLSLWLLHTITRSKYANILFKNSTIDMITTLPKFEREHDITLSADQLKRGLLGDLAMFMNVSSAVGSKHRHSYVLPSKRWLMMKVIRKVSSTESRENAQAVKWIIINTISYPLLLYYHFHSSSCLSTMWKMCYC